MELGGLGHPWVVAGTPRTLPGNGGGGGGPLGREAPPPPHEKSIFLEHTAWDPWAEGGEACYPGAGAEVRFAVLAGGGRTASVATG